ncbi:MAG: MFS transporter [Ktedonobacterales bacterium]
MSLLEAEPAGAALGQPQSLSRRAVWANLTSVSGAHAVIHATVVLMPLVYPILRREYGLTYTQIGLLVAIPSFISGFLQLLFGYLGRYIARKTMIGVGNLVVGLGMFLFGLATTFGGFLGWSVVRGIGGSPQHPVGSSMLTDTFGKERHGFALAAHVAGGNLGTLLVPSLGTLLLLRFGWQPTVMLFALPGLVAGTAVLIFAREPASSAAQGMEAAKPAPGADTRTAHPAAPWWRTFLAPLRHRAVLVVIAASIVAAGGRGVGILTTYVPLYFTGSASSGGLNLGSNAVAVLFTLLLVGSVAGPLAAGRLSDRTGRRPLLFLSYGFAAVFTMLLPILGSGHVPLWAMIVEVTLLGLAAYAESPLLQAYLADSAPDNEREGAFGWYFTLAFGVGSIWSAMLGGLIDRAGFTATFFVMAASYLGAALILLLMPRTRRG